jgi:DNA primase
MSRINRARELRAALSNPSSVCRQLGLDRGAQRQSRGLVICCPYHAERTPSCSVRVGPDGTIGVKCFACGATGDALSLVAHVCGLDVRRDFRAVLAEAAAIAGMPGMRLELSSRPEPARIDDPAFHAVATNLIELCPLDGEPDVMGYVAGRGLLPAVADAGLFALPRASKQRGIIAELVRRHGADALERAGLLWHDRATRQTIELERFAWPGHRLGIPWRSPDGRVQAIQRRSLDAGDDRKYVFGRGRPACFPFGVERLASTGRETPVAFTEGALDALALRLLASRNGETMLTLGLPGVNGWRSGWAKLAEERRAFVAIDADDAGERKRADIVDDLHAAGAVSVARMKPKGGKDWTDLLRHGAQ